MYIHAHTSVVCFVMQIDSGSIHIVHPESLGLELHDRIQTLVSLMYIFYKVVGFRRSGHIWVVESGGGEASWEI